jgi:dTDP-4-dehydrorhamnose reductase
MNVLITGASGQLGQAIQFISDKFTEMSFVYCNSTDLDITNLDQCKAVFAKHQPNFCINAAAYTAVDKAESEQEKAFAINATGAQILAEVCKQNNIVLLHISTDFVFDGNSQSPYTETNLTNPTGVYGQTKLNGEIAIQQTWEKHFIIRTSWVYSQFANNFYKTMLRLASERDSLSVVADQVGTPTNANDLAEVLLVIINTQNLEPNTQHLFGIYNFSNESNCSWYEFAAEIFKQNNISVKLSPIPTTAYPTPAKRPAYSVLDKTKIKEVFGVEIKEWQESLKNIKL